MTRVVQPTKEQEAEWREWVESRPPVVRAVAEKLDPWTLYRLNCKHRVSIVSIFEDGTVKVNISGRWNAIIAERQVFGIDPNDLEPCDPPGPDEPVGALMDLEDAVRLIR
jgi:hypothetical protein